MRIRTRRRSLYALAVLLLAGACGGGAEVAPPPTIEPATAERLAATSDSIADLIDAGDVCGAAGRADELLAQVTEAINAGNVPARFQEDLTSKANELVDEVNCPRPPETDDEEDDDDDEGRGKGKKKEKKNEDEELPPITIPPPTETEDE